MATIIELPLISDEGVVAEINYIAGGQHIAVAVADENDRLTVERMSPDIPCQHCGSAIMYSERSEAWLAFAWYGGVLSNICPGVESGHSPEFAA